MTLTELEHNITIQRPVQEVFAFVSRAENMPRWAEKITEAVQTSDGPVEIGTTCYVVSKAMGVEAKQDFVVTEYERDRLYAARSTSGPVAMEIRFSLETTDGGTRLHVTSSAELSGFMKLASPLLIRRLKKQPVVPMYETYVKEALGEGEAVSHG